MPTIPDPIANLLANEAWRMRIESRFWPKVAKPLGWDVCWTWLASRDGRQRERYGKIKIASHVTVRAHRLSWALYNGRSPGDLHVLHRCDNPGCVNPAHLFLGTNADNVADKIAKGRGRTGDQRGEKNGAAKLSAADVEAIRIKILAGWTNTSIAAIYGITHQAVSRIRRGRSWGAEPMQPRYASLKLRNDPCPPSPAPSPPSASFTPT